MTLSRALGTTSSCLRSAPTHSTAVRLPLSLSLSLAPNNQIFFVLVCDGKAAAPGFYSELKPEAVQKLKKLTIVTLGSQSPVRT